MIWNGIRVVIVMLLVFAVVSVKADVIVVPEDYETIQEAIDASQNGDTVFVAGGEYRERIDFGGREIMMVGNPDNPEEVVIDGGGNGSTAAFVEGGDIQPFLLGFTITNGNSIRGGGVIIENCSPVIAYCRIVENRSRLGGGIYCGENSAAQIIYSTISDNLAQAGHGGGIRVSEGARTSVAECEIANNSSASGAGISIASNNTNISNCIIRDNEAVEFGGGIGFREDINDINVSYCIIHDNSAAIGGAIDCEERAVVSIDHCTIAQNRSPAQRDQIGGVNVDGSMRINNTIIWDNLGFEVRRGRDAFLFLAYSDIDVNGGIGGGVNEWIEVMRVDPGFEDPGNDVYQLIENSPCIDTGDPNSPLDPDRTRTDMGALYFNQLPEQPVLFYEPEEIDFGESPIRYVSTKTLFIQNRGREDLEIIEIEALDRFFSVDFDEALVLASFDSVRIEIDFQPEDEVAYDDRLIVSSNDPDNEEAVVMLNGVGGVPPVISVDPEEIEDELYTGARSQHQINIANSGGSNLDWEARIEVVENEDRLRHSRTVRRSGHERGAAIPRRDDPGDILRRLEAPYPVTTGMAWDGELMWAVSMSNNHLYAVDPESEEVAFDQEIHRAPYCLAFDGRNLWTTSDQRRDQIWIYDREGNVVNEFQIPFECVGITSDDEGGMLLLTLQDNGLPVVNIFENDEFVEVPLFGEQNVPGLALWLDWVPAHHNGKLWTLVIQGIGENQWQANAYQFELNENNEIAVANIVDIEPINIGALSHDGTDLWVGGSIFQREWLALEDGVWEVDWIRIDPGGGSIEPDSESEVTLFLNAVGLDEGDMEAILHIDSDDPENPDVQIPVTMSVIGAPAIELEWEAGMEENLIDWNRHFPELYVDGDYGVNLTVRNIGTEELVVEEIAIDNEVFSVDPVEFSIDIDEEREVALTFAPDRSQEIEAELNIVSNDPDDEEISIDIHARAFEPPVFVVEPLEVQVELFTGGRAERTIMLLNEGEAQLNWNADIEIFAEPEIDRFRREVRSAGRVRRGPLRDEPGDVIDEIELPVERTAGVCWDGSLVWGLNVFESSLFAFDPRNEAIVQEFRMHQEPAALAYDGELFWISDNRNVNRILKYDREGEFQQMIVTDYEIIGMTCDSDGHIIVASSPRRAMLQLLVINVEDGEEIARIANMRDLLETPIVSGVEYVPAHESGNLWISHFTDNNGENTRIWQIAIDENWQPQIVQEMEVQVRSRGLAHDGENLWLGSERRSGWTIIDDGVNEQDWIAIDPIRGGLGQDEDAGLFVNFDAEGLIAGEYEASILLHSNDPENELVEIAVLMTVEGAPDIAVEWEIGMNQNLIDWNEYFDVVYMNGEYAVPVAIRNLGAELLEIEELSLDNEAFSAPEEGFELEPEEENVVEILFAPDETGVFEGVLTIAGNDPDEREIEIDLRGQAFAPPQIELEPMEIETDMQGEEVEEHVINIYNSGEADLVWEAEIEIVEAPEADVSRLRKVRPANARQIIPSRDDPGEILDQFQIPILNVSGMASDGELVYAVSYQQDRLIALDKENGEIVLNTGIHGNPLAMTWDGGNLWIGQWNNSFIFLYDGNGDLIEQFNMPFGSICGMGSDRDEYIYMLSRIDMRIHVINIENRQEAALIDPLAGFNNEGNVWGVDWVPDHPEGQLWGLRNGRMFQVFVDEEWNAQPVQNFACNADTPYPGPVHDGVDIWHGMWNSQTVFKLDDGVEESRWLTLEPDEGSLAPDEDLDLIIALDATGLISGDYIADLHFLSNDPDESDVEIRATMRVQGVPDVDATWEIGMEDNLIDWNRYYEDVFVEGRYPVAVTVINNGTEILAVDDIVIDNEAFSIENRQFEVGIEESREVEVFFLPEEPAEFEAELIIVSNDPNEGELSINLRAQAFEPPSIVIEPMQLEAEQYVDEVTEQAINIFNEGEAVLRWHIEYVIDDGEAVDHARRNVRRAEGEVVDHARRNVRRAENETPAANSTWEKSLSKPQRDDRGDLIGQVDNVLERVSGMASDGERLWGCNMQGGMVSIAIDDHEDIEYYDIHEDALAMAFDGERIWIGDWGSPVIRLYDLRGAMVEQFNAPFVDIAGMTSDLQDYMFLYSFENMRIHVLDVDSREEAASFDPTPGFNNNRGVWGILWVNEHVNGQLWGLAENRLYQARVDEDWNVQAVANFACRADAPYTGPVHDGEDIWHGMRDSETWYIYDDGVFETPPWFEIEPDRGELEGQADTDLIAMFDTHGIRPAQYETYVRVISNDPDDPFVEIGVFLEVLGAPYIETDPVAYPFENPDEIRFPDTFVENGRSAIRLVISNVGSSVLIIEDVESENNDFSTELEVGTEIEPGEEMRTNLVFHPRELGERNGSVDIYTNARNIGAGDNLGRIWFEMSGESVIAPVIESDPGAEHIYSIYNPGGGIVQRTLNITNNGPGGAAALKFWIGSELNEENDQVHNTGKRRQSAASPPSRDEAGDIIDVFEIPFDYVTGLASDGELIWGVNNTQRRLFALNYETNDIEYNIALDFTPLAMAFDGEKLWIAEFRTNRIHRYNLEGGFIDQVEIPYNMVYGLASDRQSYLFVNARNDFLVHVLDLETGEEIRALDVRTELNGVETGSIEWVNRHPLGQLWCLADEHVYQLYVDENWELSLVQDFDLNARYRFNGLTHDGENLWNGMFNENLLYVHDDGTQEINVLPWISSDPVTGFIERGGSREVAVIFDLNQIDSNIRYDGSVLIGSNDPATPEIHIPFSVNTDETPRYFNDFTETGFDHTIGVAHLSFDENAAPTGWEIGVYTSGGVLAGGMIWNAELDYVQEFRAYGDDPETQEIEGFAEGEELTFRVWDNYANVDDFDVLSVAQSGPENWMNDSASTFSLEAYPMENSDSNLLTPGHYSMSSAYPNPFNASTRINYSVPIAGYISIAVYDLRGRLAVRLVDGVKSAGVHTVEWLPSDFNSGIYLVRMEAGRFVDTKKITLIK